MNLKKLLDEMVTTGSLSNNEIPKRFLKVIRRKSENEDEQDEMLHMLKKKYGLKKKS
jgi:polyhydroxyalkanoate synthesis regulator phasin